MRYKTALTDITFVHLSLDQIMRDKVQNFEPTLEKKLPICLKRVIFQKMQYSNSFGVARMSRYYTKLKNIVRLGWIQRYWCHRQAYVFTYMLP